MPDRPSPSRNQKLYNKNYFIAQLFNRVLFLQNQKKEPENRLDKIPKRKSVSLFVMVVNELWWPASCSLVSY
ncbi:MAG: hypothetical protein K0Q50_124 [Vampirovibrio sp.]|jgi:hypothetical protein|nr:hypothetical protein [Vampirovibrio sp.]